MTGNDINARLASLSPAKRALLELKLKQSGLDRVSILAISRRTGQQSLPLSFSQQRLWFISQLEPENCNYNETTALRLDGELNITALHNAVNTIIERHEILRTCYVMANDGEPVQVVNPVEIIDLPLFDISNLVADVQDVEIQRIALGLKARPFDLSKNIPLRLGLIRLNERSHVLVEVKHHIASDAWSSNIFRRELSILYNSLVRGEAPSLPELPIQYGDFAIWQRKQLQDDELKAQLSYWREQLAGVIPLPLPTDHPHSDAVHSSCGRETLVLPTALTQELKALSGREGVTLFMTLLASFQVLLHRYTGQGDVAVGAPIAGRGRAEIEKLIGFFVNTLIFRSRISSDQNFKEFLAQVRHTVLQTFEHQEFPFEKLVEEINPDRAQSRAPLLQVMFALQNVPRHGLEMSGLVVAPVDIAASTAKFDLYVALVERNEDLILRIEYRSELFDTGTIQRMTRHFQTLLESIVANRNCQVGQLTLIPPDERDRILLDWNRTERDYPRNDCIHEIFEKQAEKSPGAVALALLQEQVTYKQLNIKANQLARFLRKHGVGPDVLVGICMERSIELVVGLLGILKAGGAYLPLDPSYPQERLAFMLEDCRASVVLTKKAWSESLPQTGARMFYLDEDWPEIATEPNSNLVHESTAENLAYVIYTSGSTGLPKGVAACHRGVLRLLFGADYVQLGPARTLLHLSPISFDAATFEVWGALLHGGQCVLFPGKVPSPREIGEVLRKHQVDTLWLTAALFNTVIDEEPQALSPLSQLLIGGEALSMPHVRKALELLPRTEIVNGYGPTESTTFTCCYSIPRELSEGQSSIPIGKPIGNTRVYILDSHMNPVPIGVMGELYIGGDGLARGYWNRAELTAEKFSNHSFDGKLSERLYRTGDWARYLADGNIEFVGRIDDQVKLRGYRIELGEIEAVLREQPKVRDAVVAIREDSSGDKRLVGYVVGRGQEELREDELRKYLKIKLPDYMVPSAFISLPTLPVTPQGKIDRKALPAPQDHSSKAHDTYVAPRDTLEQRLAFIWADVLKMERVGIYDNFFAIGGHSLLAIRLLSLMTKEMEMEIPLRRLFESPTIAEIARYYVEGQRNGHVAESSATHTNWSHLFKLKGGQGKNAVFMFPGGFGGENEALVLAQLAHFAGQDIPFYGLSARSSHGTRPAHQSVEEMARDFIKEIKEKQPEGPYHLIGHCLGGVVAYEIACQLKNKGEKIGLLGFLDTVRPTPRRYFRYLAWRMLEKLIPKWQDYYRDRMRYHWKRVRSLGWRGGAGYLTNRVGTIREVFDLTPRVSSSDTIRSLTMRQQRDNQAGHIATLLRYRPRPYDGNINALTADAVLKRHPDPTLGWGKYALRGVKTYRATGDHDSFLRDYVQNVGEIIQKWIKEAQPEND